MTIHTQSINEFNPNSRPAFVAGQFYPQDPDQLQLLLDSFKPNPFIPPPSRIRAIISPHAGYAYSGPTAMAALNQSSHFQYQRILVLAPSHRYANSIPAIATTTDTNFKTPLGNLPVDSCALNTLQHQHPMLFQTHTLAHRVEHSIEVILPMLQHLHGNLPIIPLLCGHLSLSSIPQISAALIPFWNPETLWIISSDFTHYGSAFHYLPFQHNIQENLRQLDHAAFDSILSINLTQFEQYLKLTEATICGASPIQILLSLCDLNSPHHIVPLPIAKLINYTTSGELTDDWTHSVSYASFTFSDP